MEKYSTKEINCNLIIANHENVNSQNFILLQKTTKRPIRAKMIKLQYMDWYNLGILSACHMESQGKKWNSHRETYDLFILLPFISVKFHHSSTWYHSYFMFYWKIVPIFSFDIYIQMRFKGTRTYATSKKFEIQAIF